MSEGQKQFFAFLLIYAIIIGITAYFVSHWALIGYLVFLGARYRDEYCDNCGKMIGEKK